MITLYPAKPDAPLTPWQRQQRFADMRTAQRRAYALRCEADAANVADAQLHSTPSRNSARVADRAIVADIRRECTVEAQQWEQLALWLARSVHPSGGAA
jgi:hypothetical protein